MHPLHLQKKSRFMTASALDDTTQRGLLLSRVSALPVMSPAEPLSLSQRVGFEPATTLVSLTNSNRATQQAASNWH